MRVARTLYYVYSYLRRIGGGFSSSSRRSSITSRFSSWTREYKEFATENIDSSYKKVFV
jgi:hypothetical protein